MRHANWAKRAPAVVGAIHPRVQHINAIGIAWIGKYVSVIERALPILPVTVRQGPSIAAIVGAKETAFVGFHQRPYAISAVGDCHTNAAQNSIWQTVAGEVFPRCAAIRAAIQPASRATAIHAPGSASRLP